MGPITNIFGYYSFGKDMNSDQQKISQYIEFNCATRLFLLHFKNFDQTYNFTDLNTKASS